MRASHVPNKQFRIQELSEFLSSLFNLANQTIKNTSVVYWSKTKNQELNNVIFSFLFIQIAFNGPKTPSKIVQCKLVKIAYGNKMINNTFNIATTFRCKVHVVRHEKRADLNKNKALR